MTRVILVRHAPPLGGKNHAGRSDFAVEPAPAAAEVVLRALEALERPDRIVSSPAQRCHELGRELSSRLGIALEVDPRLLEIDLGEWDGRTWDEIARTDGARLDRWMTSWREERPPGGETITELEGRVRAWLHAGSDRPDLRLAVTHAGVIRAARVLTRGEPWEKALNATVPYLVPLAFEWRGSAT